VYKEKKKQQTKTVCITDLGAWARNSCSAILVGVSRELQSEMINARRVLVNGKAAERGTVGSADGDFDLAPLSIMRPRKCLLHRS